MTTIGLLHPGEMGSMVGAAVRSGGSRVLWAGEGRSAATRKRATDAGLEDAGSLAALVRASVASTTSTGETFFFAIAAARSNADTQQRSLSFMAAAIVCCLVAFCRGRLETE